MASLGAGGIHVAAGGSHLAESLPLGVAFFLVGWLQVLLGASFWRRPTWLGAVGLGALHIAAIAAWAISRTVGLPFGHAGPQPLGVAGLVAVALQVGGVAAVGWFLNDPARVRPLPLVAAFGSAAVVLGLASTAVAGVSAGHGHEAVGDASGPEERGGHHRGVSGDPVHGGAGGEAQDGNAGAAQPGATVTPDAPHTSGPSPADGPSAPDRTTADDGHDHEHGEDPT